jgi:CBS domain-containing protein
MRTISEILENKGRQFNYIDANVTVLEALSVMKVENFSYVIVTDKGKYAGIFSENDYARKVILMDKNSATTLVREVMAADLPMITGKDAGELGMRLMNIHRTRYIPVFDDFEFKGVLTINDLMREAIADAEIHKNKSVDEAVEVIY